MDLWRSEHAWKPCTIWEQKGAPSAAFDSKISQKTAHIVKKTALKLVATELLPSQVTLEHNNLPDLPDYTSLLKLHFKHSKLLILLNIKLKAFQHFLMPEIIAIVYTDRRDL